MDEIDPLDGFLRSLDVHGLLNSKALPPLSPTDQARLAEIEALDVTGWSEADVRAEIIDPVVRILGYRKGDIFSIDRERAVQFRGSKRFVDYAATVWAENFWLIEAKRPAPRTKGFSQRDIDQALGYAIHPDINAAIVAMTDGDLWEVFDRETSVAQPMIRFRRSGLREAFDQLRRVLSPWQAWFLEKRRIVRLVDRVFDHEVNLGRVDEFRSLIDRRMQSKRGRILDNFRANVSLEKSRATRKGYFQGCDAAGLIDVHLFQSMSFADLSTISDRMVALCDRSAFQVLHRLLRDVPRDASDHYWAHALWVLIALDEAQIEPGWLPAWLGAEQSKVPLASAISKLIDLCLTYFAASLGHQAVLLWSASAKRQFKILAHTVPQAEDHARALHALNRFMTDELSFDQIVASPEGQMLGEVSRRALVATARFAAECQDDSGRFKASQAREKVRGMWAQELRLLDAYPEYMELVRDRDLGDLSTVEAAAVTWDELAHTTLCLVERSPRWREHVLQHHGPTVAFLAGQGYWSARKLLGIDDRTSVEPAPDGWAADRFFFGDGVTAERLAQAYRPPGSRRSLEAASTLV